jgi:bifunctional ADP-heptose synthase (sugar kinase/adenylyltransferase)
MCAEEHLTIPRKHPKEKEFRDRYSEAYWKIQKMTDIGAFVLSDYAAGILKKLRDKPQLEWDKNPPWEIYEADCEHYREALDRIRRCAKKDLKI